MFSSVWVPWWRLNTLACHLLLCCVGGCGAPRTASWDPGAGRQGSGQLCDGARPLLLDVSAQPSPRLLCWCAEPLAAAPQPSFLWPFWRVPCGEIGPGTFQDPVLTGVGGCCVLNGQVAVMFTYNHGLPSGASGQLCGSLRPCHVGT